MSEGLLKVETNSKKKTHAGRRAGAQHAQLAGADIAEISQQGGWNRDRVVTHYMSNVPHVVPYKLAGFRRDGEDLWLARNTLIPPVELQRMVFPFIEDVFLGVEDWRRWIENIMFDRDNSYGRPQGTKHEYPDRMIPAMRILIIFAHLRKVVLQDMAILITLREDPQCYYDEHRIFVRSPVFKSTLFKDFCKDLKETMDKTVSPLADSLAANAPAISEQLNVVNTGVTGMSINIEKQFVVMHERLDEHGRQLGVLCRDIRLLGPRMEMLEHRIASSTENALLESLQGAAASVRKSALQRMARMAALSEQSHMPDREHQNQQERRGLDWMFDDDDEVDPDPPLHRVRRIAAVQPPLDENYVRNQDQDLAGRDNTLAQERTISPPPPPPPLPRDQDHAGTQVVGIIESAHVPPEIAQGLQQQQELLLKQQKLHERQVLEAAIANKHTQIEPVTNVFNPKDPCKDIMPTMGFLTETQLECSWSGWFIARPHRNVPSYWKLNQTYGSKNWRTDWDNTYQQRYSQKKRLIEITLDRIAMATGVTLDDKIEEGKRQVQDALVLAKGATRFLKDPKKYLQPAA